MFLSAEQQSAVYGGGNEIKWSIIDRPVGPQPVPEWCKGVHVDWMDGYSNWPDMRLKTTIDARSWENKIWRKEGHYYRAYHIDGRMEQYAHDGPVTLEKIKMFRGEDGVLRQRPRYGAEWYVEQPNVKMYPPGGWESGEWEEVEMLCTTRQAGFGGDCYHLNMDDGRTIVLRGPWHVGTPAGYTEFVYVDTTSDLYRRRKWFKCGGRGGLYLRNDVTVNILSRFAAHLPLALVDYGFTSHIEPFLEEWGVPKKVKYEREFQERRALAADNRRSEMA